MQSVHQQKPLFDSQTTNEDVYNFRVVGNDAQAHIIVAEGVFVGDLSWQNELAAEMESIRLRK